VLVVGTALVGRGADRGTTTEPSPSEHPVPASAAPGELQIAGRAPLDRWATVIVLDAPARTALPVATSEIVVRGHLLHDTAFLQVLFQSRTAGLLYLQTIYPMTVPVGNDRSEGTAFVTTMPLPDVRPIGAGTLQIIAYDAQGQVKDVLSRAIQIGTLLDATYGALAAKPPTGEDGLMGGITFGTNFAPRDTGS
jgi:hypothetical protein